MNGKRAIEIHNSAFVDDDAGRSVLQVRSEGNIDGCALTAVSSGAVSASVDGATRLAIHHRENNARDENNAKHLW